MLENITGEHYFMIREYPFECKDFEVKDMFPNSYTRTWGGLQDGSALISSI